MNLYPKRKCSLAVFSIHSFHTRLTPQLNPTCVCVFHSLDLCMIYSCRRSMARQSSASCADPCKLFLIYLLLFSMLPPLMQCRPLTPKMMHEKRPKIMMSRPAAEHEIVAGLRVGLVHRDSPLSPLFPGNITSTERVKQAVGRSQERLGTLVQRSLQMESGGTVLPKRKLQMEAPLSRGVGGRGEFMMTVGIGEPSLSYSGIVDTGSDLIWAQCLPCDSCLNQSSPIYDPSHSSTYKAMTCESSECQSNPVNTFCGGEQCHYLYEYADRSSSAGILSSEKFTFSSHQSVQHIVFGCGQDNHGDLGRGGGMVGFGRGSLSLISQLASLGIGNKFSYCLMPFTDSPSKVSPLFIGHTATLNNANASSTPFVQNMAQSSFYYLSLGGISVGGALLDNIPAATFDIQDDGSGGFMIDSGTTLTYLYVDAYNVLKNALISSINLPQADGSPIHLDLCYSSSSSHLSNFPTITFHFKGGADYDLPPQSYMYVDHSSDIMCLSMLPSSHMSVLGNFQQQNYHFLYDNDNNMLSFAPTVCDAL